VRGRRPRSVPTIDGATFRRAQVRTGAFRVVLVVLAVALVALAWDSARKLETHTTELSPRGASVVVVVDLSLSIVGQDYLQIRDVLERLIQAGNPTGLVVFSDTAYELLPPRTPVKEIVPLLRYFTMRNGSVPRNPWEQSFQAGTRISTALEVAYRMLRRDHVRPGSILLVSDLATAPDDYAALGRTLRRITASGDAVRVAPLSPSADARQFFRYVLGADAFANVAAPKAGGSGPLGIRLHGELPVGLLAASALALLALAAHEILAGRLALPAGAGWRKA